MTKKVIASYIFIITVILMFISRHYLSDWGILSMIPVAISGFYFYNKLMRDNK